MMSKERDNLSSGLKNLQKKFGDIEGGEEGGYLTRQKFHKAAPLKSKHSHSLEDLIYTLQLGGDDESSDKGISAKAKAKANPTTEESCYFLKQPKPVYHQVIKGDKSLMKKSVSWGDLTVSTYEVSSDEQKTKKPEKKPAIAVGYYDF